MNLNWEKLNKISYDDFVKNKKFPYIEIDETFSNDKFELLLDTLPKKELFTKNENIERNYGQGVHERLGYGGWNYKDLILNNSWKSFIDEIRSQKYKKFLHRLFGTKNLNIRFMWHYASKGQSVSPHYDSDRKLGSHIFYFNSKNWDNNWGGQTLLCFDNNNEIPKKSAPRINDFDEIYMTKGLPNSSLLFRNSIDSWHSVEALNCPENYFRKVFIIVIEKETITEKFKRFFTGLPERGVT